MMIIHLETVWGERYENLIYLIHVTQAAFQPWTTEKPFHKFCPNPFEKMNSAPLTVGFTTRFIFRSKYLRFTDDFWIKSKTSCDFLEAVDGWFLFGVENDCILAIICNYWHIAIAGSREGGRGGDSLTSFITACCFFRYLLQLSQSLLVCEDLIDLREFLQAHQFHLAACYLFNCQSFY